METDESIRPSDTVLDHVQEILAEEGPLTHEEIVKKTSIDDSNVQRALNELWREDNIYHTIDRRFDLKPKEGE